MSRFPKFSRGDLISDGYLAEQVRLHEAGYGGRGSKWAPEVARLADAMGLREILDYGCGQGSLGVALRGQGRTVWDYDPARVEFETHPREFSHARSTFDLVTCTDVLEHIEPSRIDNLLQDLRGLTGKALFTVISLVDTEKKLSDGRSAHILIKPERWWDERLYSVGFERRLWKVKNPKPEKQFAAVWAPRRVDL